MTSKSIIDCVDVSTRHKRKTAIAIVAALLERIYSAEVLCWESSLKNISVYIAATDSSDCILEAIWSLTGVYD
jgi:hypothetical protein